MIEIEKKIITVLVFERVPSSLLAYNLFVLGNPHHTYKNEKPYSCLFGGGWGG